MTEPNSKRRKVSDLTENEKAAHKAMIANSLHFFTDAMIMLLQIAEKWEKITEVDGDYAANAYSAVMTYHKARCQQANGSGAIKDHIADGKTVKVAGASLGWVVIRPALDKLATAYKLEYAKGSTDPWYGVCNPTLYSFAAFHHRMREIHVGTLKFETGVDANGARKMRTISYYGMLAEHSVLCEGISFPPYMKGPLLSSLGPGTLLAYLVDNSAEVHNKYVKKVKDALIECLSQVPRIEEIIETISNVRLHESQPLIRELCNYLLLGGYKVKNRAFFPPALLLQDMKDRRIITQAIDDTTPPAFVNNTAPTLKWLKNFDLTGSGMWETYHQIKAAGYRFEKYGSEIITHCILGTHKEDLGILNWATGTNFHTRTEVADSFAKRSEQSTVSCTPVKFTYISKLVTANYASQLATRKSQITSVPVLGGFRKRHISDELRELLSAKQGGAIRMSMGPRNLVQEMADEIERSLHKFDKDSKVGTVVWFKANAAGTYTNDEAGKAAIITELPIESGKYYR